MALATVAIILTALALGAFAVEPPVRPETKAVKKAVKKPDSPLDKFKTAPPAKSSHKIAASSAKSDSLPRKVTIKPPSSTLQPVKQDSPHFATSLTSAKIATQAAPPAAPIPRQPPQSARSNKTAGKTPPDEERRSLEEQYAALLAELTLSRTGAPYLVLDFGRRRISLKMKDAVVWDQRLILDSSFAGRAAPFVKEFIGGKKSPVRLIVGRYLYSAQERIADTLVTEVGKILNVKPELLQRELPAYFHLLFGGGLQLDVRSDVKGKINKDRLVHLIRIRDALRHFLGKPKLVIWMPPEEALTLYRVATPGVATLVVP